MGALAGFVRFAEAVNDYVGRIVAWLTLATVLVCATVVFIRYALQTGFVWMQELYVWTHAAAFMLGAGYTLMANKHVRVDILYARASPKKQAWLDLISTFVFLFPWVTLLSYFAWPYVLQSWELWETSSQVGGMPGLYIMKTIILAFGGLMFLQGLAICARSVLILNDQGHLAPPRVIAGLGE
jgi:TRAP-type mannitol/chloroaromatic compound transport system permease small subunit